MSKKDKTQTDNIDNTDNTEMETETMKQETPSYEDLLVRVAELEAQLEEANQKKTIGRKEQVLALLQEKGHVSIPDIAKSLQITDRNVSSQLSYLRKDGWRIATDSRGYKFLETDEPNSD